MNRRKFILVLLAVPVAVIVPPISPDESWVRKRYLSGDELNKGTITLNEARASLEMTPITDVIQIEYIDHNGENTVLYPHAKIISQSSGRIEFQMIYPEGSQSSWPRNTRLQKGWS